MIEDQRIGSVLGIFNEAPILDRKTDMQHDKREWRGRLGKCQHIVKS